MIDAAEDPLVRHAFFLLTQIPAAAKSVDFAKQLGRVGVNVREAPSLVEISAAMMDAIDEIAFRIGHRTD